MSDTAAEPPGGVAVLAETETEIVIGCPNETGSGVCAVTTVCVAAWVT